MIKFSYFPRGFEASEGPTAKFDLKRDWRPEMPQFIVTELKGRFNAPAENQRAILQLARAFWMTLDPEGDLDSQFALLTNALDCAYYRQIPYENFEEVKAIVFFNNQLINRFLKWDRQLAGGVYPGRKVSEANCETGL